MAEELEVDAGGARLDQFLAVRFSGYSRSYFKDLIQRGRVTVDGDARRPDFRVSPGQTVRVEMGGTGWPDVRFEDWILHEDADLLVLRKPAGILTHPMGASWERRPQAALSETEPSLAGLMARHRPNTIEGGVSRCGIVHRLDRQTSGVLLVAKRPRAQRALLKAFKKREVRKVYRALVLGELSKTEVEAPVGRLPGRRRIQVTPWGKEALTRFRSVKSAKGLSLVEAEPKTGRTHQIRAHLALLKHPVLGDPEWFRDREQTALAGKGLPLPPRMLLHAYRIRFTHPTERKPVSFTAPLPKDFQEYWKRAQRA